MKNIAFEMSEWEEYISEIELIEKQNNVEYDLYSVIAPILKRREDLKEYSIRDISHRRRTKEGRERLFWGIKGFPDFVIMDKNYDQKETYDKSVIYGVIEAKYVNKPIDDSEDKLQLKGHLLSFGTVIYTNGYIWKIYKNTKNNKAGIKTQENKSYATKAEDKKTWEEIDNWLNKKVKSLDKYSLGTFILKKDEESSWNKTEWDRLIKALNKFFSNDIDNI